MSLNLIKMTRDDSRRSSTLAKVCHKAGKHDAAYDYEVFALRTFISVEEYEAFAAAYQAYRDHGTLPN